MLSSSVLKPTAGGQDALDVWNADSQQTAALFAALAQARPAANCLADNRCSAVACPEVRSDPACGPQLV